MTNNVEKVAQYLDETGIENKFKELKIEDKGFKFEIPIDEENGKYLKGWLSKEGSDGDEYAVIEFEGILKFKMTTDGDRLYNWLNNSGMKDFLETCFTEAANTQTEVTEA